MAYAEIIGKMRLSACKLNSSINYYYFFEKEETLILIYKNLISPALISTIYNDFLDLVFSHSFWLVTSQPIELHYSTTVICESLPMQDLVNHFLS